MTWHSQTLDPTFAIALLALAIGAASFLLVPFLKSVATSVDARQKAITTLSYYGGALAIGLGLLIFALSTFEILKAFLVETPESDFRWLSLLFLGVVGAPFVIWRSIVAQRQADTAEQGLITDRINKGVEGLGAEKTVKRPVRSSDGTLTYEEATEPNLEVRVGAVLALERIAKDSPDDHIQIMEILCAYIRENACIVNIGSDEEPNWQQRVDTQTAITVIGCRKESAANREREAAAGYTLDLRHANLQCADMSSGRFDKAQFEGALLGKTNLGSANLQGANLRVANLQGANLGHANLQGADLGRANLQGAKLEGANLREANLLGANLQGADLGGANLQGAKLRVANLQGANLGHANL